MAITTHYGEKQGTTCLEIYSVPNNSNERITHRILKDQDAYDAWHLQYYFQEVLETRRLLRSLEFQFADLPRKEKSIFLYLLLSLRPELREITELGSSLYEMIDGLELTERYLSSIKSEVRRVDLKSIRYRGIELSSLLARASIELHPGYSLDIVPTVLDYKGPTGLIYERSVTSYAFETAAEVATFFNTAEVTFTNIFLSKDETFRSARLGKTLVYFSLRELLDKLNKPLLHIFGERDPGPASGHSLRAGRDAVEGFFLVCDPKLATSMVELGSRTPGFKEFFAAKNVKVRDAAELLG